MPSHDHDLITAVEHGDRGAVEKLLASHPQAADARSTGGVSALMTALYYRQEEIAALLAEAKSELDLFEAAALDRSDRLRALLDETPDAVGERSPDGFTALHLAAFLGGAEVASLLLERGADPEAVADNPTLVRPLHSAVAAGALEVVEALLAQEADPNSRQQAGYTPLMGAASGGRRAIVDRLLAAGADPSLTSDDGKTAADHARGHGYEALAERLGAS